MGPDTSDEQRLLDETYAAIGVTSVDAPAKRSNKRGERTREKLLRAAVDCFSEYGYTKTRISDITHRAETSQGNFYRHFTGLDDVFLAALRPSLLDLMAATARKPTDDDELSALINVNVTFLQAYARHRHILRVLREAAAITENGGFRDIWLQMRETFVARTRRWLTRLQQNGQLADINVDLMAESLGCMTDELAYIHIAFPAATPRRERIEELGESLGQIWYRAVLPVPESGRQSA